MMRPQLAAATLMAVILATFMNTNSAMPSLSVVPSHLHKHDPQDTKENNITDDSVVQEKAYQPLSVSENFMYFVMGVLIVLVLMSSCHLIFAMVCKNDRMHERAFDCMLNNDRHRGQQFDRVVRWNRNPPILRFPTHPEISSPLLDIPSSIQVFPQDPFYKKVHDNLHTQLEGEANFVPRHIQGPQAPRRVTISSPFITETSHY